MIVFSFLGELSLCDFNESKAKRLWVNSHFQPRHSVSNDNWWKWHINARQNSIASHLAYRHTTVPSDIGRTSLNNIHIHVGIDISPLMSCSVTLHFVTHPANATRIQHVSSERVHEGKWWATTISASPRDLIGGCHCKGPQRGVTRGYL